MTRAKARSLAVILALGGGLAACQQYQWVHPTRSMADYGRDRFTCERRAAAIYPTVPGVYQEGGGYYEGGFRSCYRDYWGGLVCRRSMPVYVPPTYSTRDLNEGPRAEAVKACLFSQGYQLVPVKN
jgi:hypothetical protein